MEDPFFVEINRFKIYLEIENVPPFRAALDINLHNIRVDMFTFLPVQVLVCFSTIQQKYSLIDIIIFRAVFPILEREFKRCCRLPDVLIGYDLKGAC